MRDRDRVLCALCGIQRLCEYREALEVRQSPLKSPNAPNLQAASYLHQTMESVWFDGPAGRLEGKDHPAPGRTVLMLHPHPKYQGSMGSRLIYDVAKGLHGAGYHVVRFNFRGVGRSEGQYDAGNGELADALAVYDQLALSEPPIVLGYSFGSAVAVALSLQRPVGCLLLVAPPPKIYDSELHPKEQAPHVDVPVQLVVGTNDEFVSPEECMAYAGEFPYAELTVLDGAHHFLEPSQNPRVVDWALSVLSNVS